MEARCRYIASAVARGPAALDAGPPGYVALASSHAFALLDMHDDSGNSNISHTFAGHKKRINCIRWIRNSLGKYTDKIITGSADFSAIIWKTAETDKNSKFVQWSQLLGHTGGVTMADALDGTILYAVTTSVDSTIRIWRIYSDGNNDCVQNINLGRGLCLTLQLFTLPKLNVPILACAFDDNTIKIYSEVINNQYKSEFSKVQTLIGHDDWVRGLDFVKLDDNKIMLASSSQDTYIRLWSFDYYVEQGDTLNSGTIKIERQKFTISDVTWTISLEAVLCGHENWVYGVHWNYDNDNLRLLSASLDKSIIIWEQDNQNKDNIWIEKVRVGEVGGGGLGFYGGKFCNNGNTIIGHGYLGSLHVWKYIKELDYWEPDIPCGGHFNEVVDLSWEPEGQFITTVSLDQTTRVHAPWIRDNRANATWHELARPQIHGYDMSSLAVISRHKFASGAEEKVIRTFESPQNFIENFHTICNIQCEEFNDENVLPAGASVPSLGLSNKAVYLKDNNVPDLNEKKVDKQYTENRFILSKLKAPPTEEILMQNTLWPEQSKLYGHGFEVYALAASKDGNLLASSCRATKSQHAIILLWNTTTWLQIQSLSSHQLTVTQLAFSPDNLCLLSVSRDRRWSIFRRESTTTPFELDATTDKSNGIHARIIWCCGWTHDSLYFATGSRDGKVVAWTRTDTSSSWKNFTAVSPILNLPKESITALSFAPVKFNENYILSAGFECGRIHIYTLKINANQNEWLLNLQFDESIAHQLTVKRLAFRPLVGEAGENNDPNKLQLASASSDYVTKIFTLTIAS